MWTLFWLQEPSYFTKWSSVTISPPQLLPCDPRVLWRWENQRAIWWIEMKLDVIAKNFYSKMEILTNGHLITSQNILSSGIGELVISLYHFLSLNIAWLRGTHTWTLRVGRNWCDHFIAWRSEGSSIGLPWEWQKSQFRKTWVSWLISLSVGFRGSVNP